VKANKRGHKVDTCEDAVWSSTKSQSVGLQGLNIDRLS